MGNGDVARRYCWVDVFLFGKPAWELDGFEGEELKEGFADELERLGEGLVVRLREVARVFRLLLGRGWGASGGLYDVEFTKDVSKEEAVAELGGLGLDLEVEEEEYEEDEDEEETHP